MRKAFFAERVWSGPHGILRTLAFAICLCYLCAGGACAQRTRDTKKNTNRDYPVTKTEKEWRETLPEEAYRILREKGTEQAFTGKYWDHHEAGIYLCAACGETLFDATSKFDSGSGWPSFYRPVKAESVEEHQDSSLGIRRIEIVCAACGGHLGHIFEDGPKPTGKRYCINSASLSFKKEGESK